MTKTYIFGKKTVVQLDVALDFKGLIKIECDHRRRHQKKERRKGYGQFYLVTNYITILAYRIL